MSGPDFLLRSLVHDLQTLPDERARPRLGVCSMYSNCSCIVHAADEKRTLPPAHTRPCTLTFVRRHRIMNPCTPLRKQSSCTPDAIPRRILLEPAATQSSLKLSCCAQKILNVATGSSKETPSMHHHELLTCRPRSARQEEDSMK